jgi:TonB family protein
MASRLLLCLALTGVLSACSTGKFTETLVHIAPPADIAAGSARPLPKMKSEASADWYPAQAKREGSTGRVLVSFQIDQAGHVHSEQIVGADAVPLLLDAALKLIRGAQFEVAEPEAATAQPYRVTVRYCLGDCGAIVPFAGTADLLISSAAVSKH